jgi:pimeloyl-ACP methyl ester carboxylesterase
MRGEFVDLDGRRLYCYAAGTRGAGPPIVLVHGAFTSSHLWRDVVPRLPAGHRVLVLDLLGHGRSDLPVDAAYDVDAHAERLHRLLVLLGVEPACFVGHGLGAAVVSALARRAPERVAHLVLVNPCLVGEAGDPVPPPGALRRLAWLAPLFERLPPAWLASTLHTTLLRGYTQRTTGGHVLDVYLKPYRSIAGRAVAGRQLRALARRASGVRLTDLAIPTSRAILLGGNDPSTRRAGTWHVRATHEPASDAVLVVADVATAIPEEAPDRVAATVAAVLTPLT